MIKKYIPPLYIFLSSLFPVLFLVSNNKELNIIQIFYPFLIILCISLILFYLLLICTKGNNMTAGLIAVNISLFHFSFPHFLRIIPINFKLNILGYMIGPYKFLIFLIFFILIIIYFFLIRKKNNVFSKFLTNMFIFLILFSSMKIIYFQFNKNYLIKSNKKHMEKIKKNDFLPNIYWIILDSYARSDVLKEIFKYDNTKFINFLEKQGFFIGKESFSNYNNSIFSISSALNGTYWKNTSRLKQFDEFEYVPKIKNNMLWNFLKKQGYKIATFHTPYLTDFKDSDFYFSCSYSYLLNELSLILFEETPLFIVLKKIGLLDINKLHRRSILTNLDKLKKIYSYPKPLFVFAHIICPHPPFIFDQNGNYTNSQINFTKYEDFSVQEFRAYYRNQAIFISKKIKNIILEILDKEKKQAIIILQGDHGARGNEILKLPKKQEIKLNFAILNAYYFPNFDYSEISKDISPVNTFKIILNYYFKQKLSFLPNKLFNGLGQEIEN